MENNRIKPDALFKQLFAIASKFVESHDVLTKELVDRNKGVYALRNTEHPIIMDNKPQFYLMQVKNSNGLFIHISVTLKPPYDRASLEQNHEFEGASIQFLQGTKKLFCRAEWDVKKEKEKLEHPQPHWHWGYAEEKEPERFVAINPDPFIGGEIRTRELPVIDFNELHYV